MMIINLHISHLLKLRAIKMLTIKIMRDHRKHNLEDKEGSQLLVGKGSVSVEIECE